MQIGKLLSSTFLCVVFFTRSLDEILGCDNSNRTFSGGTSFFMAWYCTCIINFNEKLSIIETYVFGIAGKIMNQCVLNLFIRKAS